MGKKGAKRKTRWRTLSIGTPPGEEDEEDGLKNGYVKGQENGTSSRPFDRNGQTGYKPRKTGTGTTTSGYTSASSKSRRDDSTGSPSQPKIIFNEEEYTRITTPRQDVLFKKGYLTQKKPWTSTASTSATPSTTESQSASHSTADGSETTEDQQLLDSGAGEYSSVIEPAAQLGYGTFYDHASGYYYEYPVMLVGPPMPEQMEPNCLAAMSCGPVPLRPIEWVNPTFVPKIDGQQFCYTDYQTAQSVDCASMVDAQGMMVTGENSNINSNESYAGSASCSGSIAGEDTLEQTEEIIEELPANKVPDSYNGGPYIEPTLVPPMHITPVVQPLPQSYMYPGHYMFGPSLVNVNGVTIQSGPMVRYNDVMATTTPVTCAKWRRKKRKRKHKRPIPGNTEDEEEEEYSSEWENGSTRHPWTANSSTTTSAATTTTRPLNPECQEFQLRSIDESQLAKTGVVAPENTVLETVSSLPSLEMSTLHMNRDSLISEGNETVSTTNMLNDCPLNGDKSKRLTESSPGFPQEPSVNETDGGTTEPRGASEELNDSSILQNSSNHISQNPHNLCVHNSPCAHNSQCAHNSPCVHNSSTLHNSSTVNSSSNVCNSFSIHNSSLGDLNNDEREQLSKEILNLKIRVNGIKVPKNLIALELNNQGDEKPCSRPASPEINRTTTPINAETQRLPESYESLVTRPVAPPRRKYNSKSAKFVREPTPGPDLTNETNPELESVKEESKRNGENGPLDDDLKISCETSNDDSGFESQVPTKSEDLDDLDRVAFEDRVESENRTKLEERVTLEDRIQSDDRVKFEDGVKFEDQVTLEDRSKFEDRVKLDDKFDQVNVEGRVNRPITEAVTKWLRKANSPDLFVTTGLESETDSEEDDENLQRKPPKNLQGNPIPALSSKGIVNNELLLCLASCSDFTKANKRLAEQLKNLETTSLVSRRKRSSRNKRKIGDKKSKTADYNGNVRLLDSVKKSLKLVGDCDFTDEDSVAGVRVALNSRMNEEVKILRLEGPEQNLDPTIVKTFEKGEIVVSIDGKLLPVNKFNYEPVLHKFIANEQTERVEKDKKSSSVLEHSTIKHRNLNEVEMKTGTENKKIEKERKETDLKMKGQIEETEMVSEIEETEIGASIGSIEEPDVLDCWETEILEPVVSPKKIIIKKVDSLEEEAEDDDFHPEVEHVKNYYRLVRESGISVEEETSGINFNEEARGTSVKEEISGISIKEEKSEKLNSGTVPNSPESLQSEEIPVFMSRKQKVSIDEAFEVYESCYNGNQYITLDPRFRRQAKYTLEDGPIPCKAVCCNIQ